MRFTALAGAEVVSIVASVFTAIVMVCFLRRLLGISRWRAEFEPGLFDRDLGPMPLAAGIAGKRLGCAFDAGIRGNFTAFSVVKFLPATSITC
jgi:hypothetical protein